MPTADNTLYIIKVKADRNSLDFFKINSIINIFILWLFIGICGVKYIKLASHNLFCKHAVFGSQWSLITQW